MVEHSGLASTELHETSLLRITAAIICFTECITSDDRGETSRCS